MTNNKQEFCERVRILRKKAGLKQKEAAFAVGRETGESWSRIERGLADSITLDMLEGLARLCKDNGISMDWLILGGEDIRNGQVIRRRGFNYVDVVADKEFAENATPDEILAQFMRTDRNMEILKNLVKRITDPDARKKYIEVMYPLTERENDD